ncbi:hypothetical protein FRB99_004590 [Tulasnella sp. 403]|nr:hypothetical protein FRB99_004590 [Tulasnella sp. 403]
MSTTNSGSNIPYVRLGKSGLKVSKLILGCKSYGSKDWEGWILDEEEGKYHSTIGLAPVSIDADSDVYSYDLGIDAFDTANLYSNGESERILGKAIKKYNLPRDEIVAITKVYFAVGRDAKSISGLPPKGWGNMRYINQFGLSLQHIFESVKHPLERLQLDYVDLLQCHRFDYDTPIEETMHDVVKAGYVRYIGMSSCWAWQCE